MKSSQLWRMVGIALAMLLCMVLARSSGTNIIQDNEAASSQHFPYIATARDLDTAASGHHHGRVQIKVYRGPDAHGDGHDHGHDFAPYGFWVKQPADDGGHHH